jgi:DNA polymerase (family 10)
MDNYDIADNFSLLAKLMDIHGENSFKSKTYSVAAFNLEKLPMQLKDTPREKIFNIKGVGDSVGKKVIEMLDTGEMKTLNEYLEKTPAGVVEMLNIKGIGAKKINTIWKELEIESVGELLYACNENRLLLYKGFGEKTQNNIRDSIEFYLQNQGSYLYAQIESYAHAMNEKLLDHFKKDKIALTGFFRRQMETIDILEWCTTVSSPELKKFFLEDARLQGGQGFEAIEEDAENILFKGNENVRVKFYLADPSSFFKKLFQTSCSEGFLIGWEKQYSIPIEARSEEEIFQSAGIPFIIPPLRENDTILGKAKENQLNSVIHPSDIRSVIHSHSNWSDGVNTIEEMANDLIKRGYEFLVISDHSKSAFYANGLTTERIKEQHRYIDELNAKSKPFKIFKSIECDILNDGSLDYSNDILATFDLVITSIHSNIKMNEEKAMMRLLNAIKNPYTTILGHMTGRLLLSRNGYPVDHKKIIDSCAENHVAIELNAHPRRLDIDWRWIDYALEKNVLISIDPDAHSIHGFNDVKYGVLAAQKAALAKEQNLTSFSLAQFEKYLEKIRMLKGI